MKGNTIPEDQSPSLLVKSVVHVQDILYACIGIGIKRSRKDFRYCSLDTALLSVSGQIVKLYGQIKCFLSTVFSSIKDSLKDKRHASKIVIWGKSSAYGMHECTSRTLSLGKSSL